METRQRDAGRWALGLPNSTIAKEFIEGELGWSSFEARETASKMMYFERIRNLHQDRWPKLILDALKITQTKVQSIERSTILQKRYGLAKIKLTRDTSGRLEWKKSVSRSKNRYGRSWTHNGKKSMEPKTSLLVYRQFKETRGLPMNLYDNSRGNRLLALARAGMLNTRTRLHKYDSSVDPNCPRCGRPETDKHVILGCDESEHTGQEFARRLGLTPNPEAKTLRRTKTTLSTWERQ